MRIANQTYILGATRTGKTSHMLSQLPQDAFCFLDKHGQAAQLTDVFAAVQNSASPNTNPSTKAQNRAGAALCFLWPSGRFTCGSARVARLSDLTRTCRSTDRDGRSARPARSR